MKTSKAIINRRYKAITPAKRCPCGNPAIQWRGCGWVCERCRQLEDRMNRLKGGSYQMRAVDWASKPSVIEPYSVSVDLRKIYHAPKY